MTHAAVPALRAAAPELAAEWEPLLTSREYDFGLRPAAEKRGALCGMAMTERQGGSDVRANTTVARPLGGGEYVLDGHEVVLLGADVRRVPRARAGAGRSLVLPAAPRAARRHAQRLPHPAAQGQARRPLERVERDRARRRAGRSSSARRAAASGRSSRWSSTRGSTACSARRPAMRQAVEQATHHAAHRSAFGKLLAEQPLMQNVLADLCVESEAATVTALRLARALRPARDGSGARPRSRASRPRSRSTGSASAAPAHAAEALECLGGNGYVEESGLPRVYRAAAAPVDLGGLGQRRLPRRAARAPARARVGRGAARRDPARGRAGADDASPSARSARSDEARRAGRRRAARRRAAGLAARAARPGAVADAFLASRVRREGGWRYGALGPSVRFGLYRRASYGR